jgi:hypothetical protein
MNKEWIDGVRDSWIVGLLDCWICENAGNPDLRNFLF